MLRRGLLTLLPALVALAFLCGTSGTSVSGPEVCASTTNAGAPIAIAPAARGSLTQDLPDVAFNQQADEDDIPDERVLRAIVAIVWPDSVFQTPILYPSDRAGDRHQPCATPPRAPPIA
jgi:hypothetical protein